MIIVRWIVGFIVLCILVCVLMYSVAPVYRDMPPQPFRGDQLYNPYANPDSGWYKANFQVASESWGGITAGHDSPDSVIAQYRKFGFDIISISDYQKINSFRSTAPDYVPVYEHGYSVWKRHHLCIGARRVNWYDLPLWQNRNHKQFILKLMRPNIEFLALAHPIWNGAFTPQDMTQLTDYDALEVLNHYRKSFPLWDAALSAGHVVWGIGDDDSHDVYDLAVTMCCWTMINAPRPERTAILDALKRGRSLCVDGAKAINENGLKSLTVNGLNVELLLDTTASRIIFIGQDGAQRSIRSSSDRAAYTFTPNDTYIRIEIDMPHSRIYLNPVFRWDGKNLPKYSATIDPWKSTLYYGLFAAGFAVLGFGYLTLRKRKVPKNIRS
jgi:hypothetical protein